MSYSSFRVPFLFCYHYNKSLQVCLLSSAPPREESAMALRFTGSVLCAWSSRSSRGYSLCCSSLLHQLVMLAHGSTGTVATAEGMGDRSVKQGTSAYILYKSYSRCLERTLKICNLAKMHKNNCCIQHRIQSSTHGNWRLNMYIIS